MICSFCANARVVTKRIELFDCMCNHADTVSLTRACGWMSVPGPSPFMREEFLRRPDTQVVGISKNAHRKERGRRNKEAF